MIAPILLALVALQAAAPVPDQPALTEALRSRDAALFHVMFDACDPDALAGMVTEDLEFYHDRGGAMLGRAVFVGDYRRGCEARRAPDAWRSRRVLVPETFKVQAIPGYGAVAEGEHLFYERQGEGPQHLVGRARFTVLWKLEADGQWRMARTFSLDHAAASE